MTRTLSCGQSGHDKLRRLLPTMFLVASPAIAAVEQDFIDEIYVTATRRLTSSSDISSALSLAGADDIQSLKLVTDALGSLVGVNVQQTTPGQGAAIIRGLKGSSILHLVDGMRLNNAIFRAAPTQYLALVPTHAVERIEVIRGTPAALYGSEAVGGVVQVVSRIPVFDLSETEIRRDVLASFDTANLHKSLSAGIDVGSRTFASSFSANYQSVGNRRTGDGKRKFPSDYDSTSARMLLAATPNDQQKWLLDIQMLEQASTPRTDELIAGFGQTQPSSSEFFFSPNQRLFAHGQHTIVGGAFGLDWKLDAAWQRIVDDRVTRDFEATTRLHESNRSDLTGISINASGKTSAASWILGAELYVDKVQSSRIEENIDTGGSRHVPSRFPDGSKVTQSAVYGSIDRSLSIRHRVSGGLRFSDVSVSVPATDVTAAASPDLNDLSGDLGWIYQANDNWQMLANIGVGFRAPNIFDLSALGNRPGNRFNIPNTNLDSEHVLHGDIGIRHRAKSTQFELVLFSLNYDDRITSVLTGDVTADGRDIVQSVNAASSRIRGAEVGVDINVSTGISAHAHLTYTWGEQRIGGDSREPADRIPPLAGRISLQFYNGSNWEFESSIEFAGNQDNLSARDLRDARINPHGTAGWAIIGVRAFWSGNDDWQLVFGANNLLDKQVRVHGSGLDEPGRNLSLSVRRAW